MNDSQAVEPPTPSKRLRAFSEQANYGRPITAEPGVWQRYIEPAFASSHRIWDGFIGATNEAGYRFEFELAIVENKNLPNAVCGFDDGSHYILLYHTLPMCLLEFFNRLVCDKRVLAEVGDGSQESDGFQSPPGFAIMMGEARIRHIDDVVATFGPRNSERKILADTLYHYAMQFVVEHEMAHAFNGHVHFAAKELSLRGVDEQTFRARSDRLRLDRLYGFLEGMADKGSYFSVISGPLLTRMHTPFQVLSSGDEALVNEVKLKILAGAFLAVFWMISDVVSSGGNTSSPEVWNDHPSSLARALAFCAMPLAQGQSLPEEIQFFLNKGTALAWQELKKLKSESGFFRPFGWLGRDDMYSTVFGPYDIAGEESKQIMHRLEPYRYRGVPTSPEHQA